MAVSLSSRKSTICWPSGSASRMAAMGLVTRSLNGRVSGHGFTLEPGGANHVPAGGAWTARDRGTPRLLRASRFLRGKEPRLWKRGWLLQPGGGYASFACDGRRDSAVSGPRPCNQGARAGPSRREKFAHPGSSRNGSDPSASSRVRPLSGFPEQSDRPPTVRCCFRRTRS
jgi:hypothetical protein